MLNRIRTLFTEMDINPEENAGLKTHDKYLAAAALMVEAASLDGEFKPEEEAIISSILIEKFQLDKEESETLLLEAKKEQSQANHLLKFTRIIKDSYSIEERDFIIEILWEVAYADGIIHDYESNLLRRMTGLLYVSERESGNARKRVEARLNINSNKT